MQQVPPLYVNVIELMKEKAKKVCTGEMPIRSLIELGELFTHPQPHMTPVDRAIAANLVDRIAGGLSEEGDERNVRAYLKRLAKDIKGAPMPQIKRRGTLI